MSTYCVLFVVLVHLSLTAAVSSRDGLGILQNIAEEYLVVLKTDETTDVAALDHRSKVISEIIRQQYDFHVIEGFKIGIFRALFVQADEEKVNEILAIIKGVTRAKNDTVLKQGLRDIQPNHILRLRQACDNEDTGSTIWGLSRIAEHDRIYNFNDKQYPYQPADGQGVTAYVLDTGINVDHSDFDGRATWGYTAPSLNEGDSDLNGHGTHVAGTIGSRTYGVAKGVKLVAVKVLNADGEGTVAALLQGLQWVYGEIVGRTGTRAICNMSLGSPGSIPTLEWAIASLVTEGLPFVVAAGNADTDACQDSPAHMEEVITVASSGKSDTLSSFSNYGTCVNIIAPGENILSTSNAGGTETNILSGTSMASPHVCGAAARYMGSLATAPTPEAVKCWLQNTASPDKISNVKSTPNLMLYADCPVSNSPDLANCNVHQKNDGNVNQADTQTDGAPVEPVNNSSAQLLSHVVNIFLPIILAMYTA